MIILRKEVEVSAVTARPYAEVEVTVRYPEHSVWKTHSFWVAQWDQPSVGETLILSLERKAEG